MERKLYLVVATFLGLAFSSCTNEVTEEIIAEASGKSSNEESEVVELKSGFTITKKDGVYNGRHTAFGRASEIA